MYYLTPSAIYQKNVYFLKAVKKSKAMKANLKFQIWNTRDCGIEWKITYIYVYMHAKSLQLCTALCNPMDCSPPGSTVHGTLQARILEWVATSSSRGYSQPWDPTHRQVGSLPLVPPSKPHIHIIYNT